VALYFHSPLPLMSYGVSVFRLKGYIPLAIIIKVDLWM
jgi:hypothetical protein